MLIRVATPADIPAMCELDSASEFGARWSDAHYAGLFASPDRLKHLVLAAEQEEQVIAYLCASGVGAEWELENVVVAQGHLRRGVARALIEELRERLQRERVERLQLEVRDSNSVARALYTRLGFLEQGRRPQYYSNPAEDAILLCLHL